jgi:hypothetical protein
VDSPGFPGLLQIWMLGAELMSERRCWCRLLGSVDGGIVSVGVAAAAFGFKPSPLRCRAVVANRCSVVVGFERRR